MQTGKRKTGWREIQSGEASTGLLVKRGLVNMVMPQISFQKVPWHCEKKLSQFRYPAWPCLLLQYKWKLEKQYSCHFV